MPQPVIVQLRARLPDKFMSGLAGKPCKASDATLFLNGDANVYRPDGEPLVMLRRGVLTAENTTAYEALRRLRAYVTDNRGVYTGIRRAKLELGDGSASKNTRTRDEDGKIHRTASAIIGYFDRQGGRHPHCRTTRFTANEVEHWNTVLPLIRRVDRLFKANLPERHAVQRKACEATHPAWVIEDTAFSTLTVNNNVVAGMHQDKGDYKDGFGVITCLRRGAYTGAWLCFPQYRVGVDLQDGDLLFFNPHEWHGMTPMETLSEDAERITNVYYFREKMVDCGTPEQELENAKKVRGKI